MEFEKNKKEEGEETLDEKKEQQLIYELLLFVYWFGRGRIVFP